MSKFSEMFYNISKEKTSENEANPVDTVTMDVPLLIRMFEYAREDANTDMDLHSITEKLIALSTNNKTLTMDVYDAIVNTDETDNKELSEGNMKKWEIIINGNSYTTAVGETQEEAITNFWKANVEKEGIERFLGDMLYAQELKTNESVTESLDEEMEAMLRIAGLR